MDPILLLCYLGADGDTRNQLMLTHDKLIVVYQGKAQMFYRSSIQQLAVGVKKLIVPLVLGGIGTSMGIIALSMGWYHRQLNLLFVFVFFAVLYYGFVGKEALELIEKGHNSIFLLKRVKSSLRRFLVFFQTSQRATMHRESQYIYHLAEPEEWERHLTDEQYTPGSFSDEGFIHASTADNLADTYTRYYSGRESMVLLVIAPGLLIPAVTYVYSEERDCHFPHIQGPLNKTAIVGLHYYSSDMQPLTLT
jgi:uncharacterized protein (DUF952 family)